MQKSAKKSLPLRKAIEIIGYVFFPVSTKNKKKLIYL